jgi:hypothetical protein
MAASTPGCEHDREELDADRVDGRSDREELAGETGEHATVEELASSACSSASLPRRRSSTCSLTETSFR